jgi:hypothetical protein
MQEDDETQASRRKKAFGWGVGDEDRGAGRRRETMK